MLIGPPSTPSGLITFSDADTCVVHFSYNDDLVITMHLGNCQMSKILVDGGSNVYILYGSALDRMEETLEIAWAMINPQTWSHLYGFDGNEMRSPDTVTLPVRADPYSIITDFYVIDMDSPTIQSREAMDPYDEDHHV